MTDEIFNTVGFSNNRVSPYNITSMLVLKSSSFPFVLVIIASSAAAVDDVVVVIVHGTDTIGGNVNLPVVSVSESSTFKIKNGGFCCCENCDDLFKMKDGGCCCDDCDHCDDDDDDENFKIVDIVGDVDVDVDR